MTYPLTCKAGHPYTDGSYAWRPDGTRRCMICDAAYRATAKIKAARNARQNALRASRKKPQQPEATTS